MIKIENVDIFGIEAAIRGMRNPMNSWDKSDSYNDGKTYLVGLKDKTLMKNLAEAGPVHAKYRRMINVTMDITAPLYWWKEFDTYKVGTVCNSCSTMHKIHDKPFEIDDFSHEHLLYSNQLGGPEYKHGIFASPMTILTTTMDYLNAFRELYLETKDKKYWWQLIQLLPSSYNQKRTIQLNYEVLSNIYKWRRHHKLDEWEKFCKWIETLYLSEIITDVNNHV